jgi:CheY-like chemotaxis protein
MLCLQHVEKRPHQNRGITDMQLDPVTNVAKGARILIVDDEHDNVSTISQILRRAGYAICISITDSAEALEKFAGIQPDVLLLDWHMEPLSGLDFIENLKNQIPEEEMPPVLVLTADNSPETRREALAVGATDFLTKPLDPSEVLLRIRNMLHMRLMHRRLSDARRELEAQVRERTHELAKAQAALRVAQQQIAKHGDFSLADLPHPLHVLVVDDQPEVLEVISNYLRQDAHTVVTARDGVEALEKFRADTFDLVITDRAMPRMNGYELATAIKHLTPDEPVILLTGLPDCEEWPDIDLTLSKPASLRMIRQAIGKVLVA